MSIVTKQDVEKCRELFDAIPRPEGKPLPVYDGIVDLKKYNNAKHKIMWILKEPNHTKGGWDICEDYLKNSQFKKDYSKWQATLGSIIQVTFGILNELPEWEKLPKMEDISSALEHIAFINVKKVPGGSTSDGSEIYQAYKKPESQKLIHCQIETYKPDIIIGGATMSILYPYFNIAASDIHKKEENCSWYSISEGRLLIDVYHPAQTTKSHKAYYMDIRTAITRGRQLLSEGKK